MRHKTIFITAGVLIIITGVLFLLLFRRTPATQVRNAGNTKDNHTEQLIRANQALIVKDAEFIKAYVERHQWQMRPAQSGLWYDIYDHGTGRKAALGKLAEIAYTLSLADSVHTVCYSSAQSGSKTFRIGQGGVEAGLEEGILLLREGDKARFILPPHLAHGLTGDNNCIPRRAVIVYDVELLNISE